MGSVLRSVGAFQGNIWSVAPFIPVGPSKNGLKKHEKSDFSKNARPIFLVFSHNSSILGMKEIPKFSRSVTYTLGWIWSGRGVDTSPSWHGFRLRASQNLALAHLFDIYFAHGRICYAFVKHQLFPWYGLIVRLCIKCFLTSGLVSFGWW